MILYSIASPPLTLPPYPFSHYVMCIAGCVVRRHRRATLSTWLPMPGLHSSQLLQSSWITPVAVMHNAELHTFYSSPNIIRNLKSRRPRWAGYVARMELSRNAYRVLVGRPEEQRHLWNPDVHYRSYIRPPLIPILSKIYPLSSITIHIPEIHFIIIFPSASRPP